MLQGERETLLEALRERGFDVSAELADRIEACTEQRRLLVWLAKSGCADSIDAVFADPEAGQ